MKFGLLLKGIRVIFACMCLGAKTIWQTNWQNREEFKGGIRMVTLSQFLIIDVSAFIFVLGIPFLIIILQRKILCNRISGCKEFGPRA